MSIKELEEIFVKLKSNDTNITGLKIGKKTTNGVATPDEALVVSVAEKIPLNLLKQDKVIPKYIEIGGSNFKTDVVEHVYNIAMPSPARCISDASNLGALDPSSPIYLNRSYINPLSGGCNFSKWTPTTINEYGTLGGIFRDKTDNTYVGLTNRHCVDKICTVDTYNVDKLDYNNKFYEFISLKVPFLNYYGSMEETFSKELDIDVDPSYSSTTVNFVSVVRNYSLNNTNYYQPSRAIEPNNIPISDMPYGKNYIGSFKRAISVFPNYDVTSFYFNYVDAALIGIKERINPTSRFQIGFNYTGEIKIATDAEIDLAYTNQYPLFFSGSRSGPIGNPGGNACDLRISSNKVIADVQDEFYPVKYSFSDIVEFESSSLIALEGGDSGSIIWAQYPDGWKIIGLNFASSLNNLTGEIRGLFCRITNVFEELNIDVWNGEPLNISEPNHEIILKNQIQFIKNSPLTQTNKAVNSIKIDGEDYYFIGMRETDKYNDITYTV